VESLLPAALDAGRLARATARATGRDRPPGMSGSADRVARGQPGAQAL